MYSFRILSAIAILAAGLSGPTLGQTGDPVRGKYLVTIGICEGCHTPRDAQDKQIDEKRFGGGRRTVGLLTPNISPDIETGIGSWSVDQIVEALRNGRRPDGSIVRPPMSIYSYRNLSDADARDIATYLKTMPPVSNKVERTPVTGTASNFPEVAMVPEPNRGDKIAYGKYLAEIVSHCLVCHSPRKDGRPDLSRAGAGGNAYPVFGGGTIVAPNITPANKDGVASWTDDQLKTVITRGVRPDGGRLISGVMDFASYSQFTVTDLDALVAYIRTLNPVE